MFNNGPVRIQIRNLGVKGSVVDTCSCIAFPEYYIRLGLCLVQWLFHKYMVGLSRHKNIVGLFCLGVHLKKNSNALLIKYVRRL